MGAAIDLTGKIFGKLTVLERIPNYPPHNATYYKVKCECGRIYNAHGGNLARGALSQCIKCAGEERDLDLTGKKFGKFTVLHRAENNGKDRKNSLWHVKCECGSVLKVRGHNMLIGTSTQCRTCVRNQEESKSALAVLNGLANKYSIVITGQVDFVTERGRKVYDGLIENTNILLEVDGSYWHRTVEQKDNDAFKTKYAIDHGYILIRIPCDSEKDAPKAIAQTDLSEFLPMHQKMEVVV